MQPAAGDGSPRATTSLRSRALPLASVDVQRAMLGAVAVPEFDARLAEAGFAEGLRPAKLEIFQINVGRLCNMSCRHCHVDAGPDRLVENMDRETVDLCLSALDRSGAHTVDITGGAPELNPHFRYLVEQCSSRGLHIIDRCNLTVLLLARFTDLPVWLGDHGVEVVASLPHARAYNTDAQRGDGTHSRSMVALQRLNEAGYGQEDPRRRLTLMHNPAGAILPGGQASMEREWKRELSTRHGVSFDRLIALNNMPIARFLEFLVERGNLDAYMQMLTAAFNPGSVDGLMCRNTISVGWDGTLYDCDFNQMLDLTVQTPGGRPHVRDFEAAVLARRCIVTEKHCFGCTAGAGSSCGGATT